MNALLLLAGLLVSQQVENRAPKPAEVGYRPADGATARTNPPSLTWLHESPAASYIVQWSTSADFAGAVTVRDVPWNTYTHSATLPAGTYHWRYRFVTRDGQESGWSLRRTFVLPESAVAFPLPTRAQQRERVPREHPRLFMRPEDLPRLREAATGKAAGSFATLRAEAEALLKAEPTPEPATMGDLKDPKTAQFWWPNRVQTLKACQEAETLAFVYLITGEKAFGEAARRWILHLAAWNPDGPTNFAINCEAAKPILHRVPRAYDWAYAALTAEDREKIRQVWRRRALDAWKHREVGDAVGHLNAPYGNHAQRTFHKLGECAIAFLGEIPEAEAWLDYALNTFYAVYPVWNDDDGGWHQGVSYWGGYMVKIVWWLQVMRSALDIDGFKKPFFDQVGDFPLYIAPPGSPNEGFGDLSHSTPSKTWGGFMEYFLRAQAARSGDGRSGVWRWWTERWGMTRESGILGFLYESNLGPLPESRPPADLPPSKVFRGVGIASLHTTLLDSKDDVHVLFKSSPFGGQSHGHNPQNSFQLNAYGEALLTTCVYRDLHGSKFHTGWCHSTVAHNAVLVDGQGQLKNSSVPSGRIAEVRLTPGWDYVAGDAADAYPGRLARYRRHLLFVKPDLVVIYDDLAATEPSTFQFMLHAMKAFEVDEKAGELTIVRPGAAATVRYLSAEPLSYRQWDGYEPKPPREFPNQWHVEAGTKEKLKECGMLTVIVPQRAEARAAWTAHRIESATALGVRFERGGKTIRIAFRKAGVAGEAEVDGLVFADSVALR